MKTFKISLFSLLVVLCISTAHSQIYKWVDSKGKVHFSDKPQSDQSTSVKSPSSQPSRNDSTYQHQLQKQQQILDAYSVRRSDNKRQQIERNQKKQQQKNKMNKRCAEYKAYLEAGGGIYKVDDNGERVFLKESEISKYRAEKQTEYDRHCQ